MNVGLLECDVGYREMFATLLPEAKYTHYKAYEGELPGSAGECQAWLCTGSRYGVYDKTDWIERLADFTRKIQEARIPYVGICFGHQMLAHALGGEVSQASQGWGVGVLPLEITSPEAWMAPAKPVVRIQHMHADQVQKLPAGAVVLGRSPHCPVGMFRVGETMLGIEGHPEFTAEFAEALIRRRRERIGAEKSDAALRTINSPNDGSLVGRWIARFLVAR